MGMFDNWPTFGFGNNDVPNSQGGGLSSPMNILPTNLNFGLPQTGAGGPAGPLAGTGLGMNVGTGQLLLGGLGTLGSLWTAWNATDLAKKQFDFQKKMSTANYMNQIQTYNTNLEDKANARYVMENRAPTEAAAYIDSHRLRPTL